MPWLESLPVEVIRAPVESLDLSVFSSLQNGDFLFIDSTHIIKPHGDVLAEYLHILPLLHRGVYVHIHDIFTPFNYPTSWINEDIRLWNEQYLLEAFLSYNHSFEIVSALNFLKNFHFSELLSVCPFLDESRSPGSFYLRKV